jgi:branched-chain amino acid transport system ATP-binding protein
MLRRLMQRSGGDDLGILLVEHDMTLVMALCDHIYVLDFGSLIFDGDPAAVRNSAVVRDAYLGNVA